MMSLFTFDGDGYAVFRDGGGCRVSIHRLVLVADGADPEKVFSGGEYHAHHKNGVPADNRPSNLEILTREEHASLHAQERDLDNYYDNSDKLWWDEDRLREMYHDNSMTMAEIADVLGVSQSTIRDRFDDFGIKTRAKGSTGSRPDNEALLGEYLGTHTTQRELADKYDVSTVTIRNWLDEAEPKRNP